MVYGANGINGQTLPNDGGKNALALPMFSRSHDVANRLGLSVDVERQLRQEDVRKKAQTGRQLMDAVGGLLFRWRPRGLAGARGPQKNRRL